MRASFSLKALWRRAGLALIAAVGCAALAAPAHAGANPGVRVAVVYNLLRFADFPVRKSTLVLCHVAGDPLGGPLATLAGRPVGSARLEVVRLARPGEGAGRCDVFYLGDSAAVPPPASGQITIGNGLDFARRGGTIGLVDFGEQVRFAINVGAGKRAGVTFSSQVLRLAARIFD